jgi:Rod binding domain-containing protein
MTPDLSLPRLVPALLSQGPPPKSDSPATVQDAAQQFEALLLSQILRSVRESSGWGGSDTAGECATDFAEQQFARVLAQQGGLGLAALISAGIEGKPADRASAPQR